MFSKLKQFKDMKDQAKHMEAELASVISEGEAAWGKVKVTMNGNRDMISTVIDPSMTSDLPKLQEALVEAHKDAIKKMQFKLAKKVQEMGGLDMLKNLGG
jgi:DNA-binding YbaB/EbfC family protein